MREKVTFSPVSLILFRGWEEGEKGRSFLGEGEGTSCPGLVHFLSEAGGGGWGVDTKLIVR